jgi:hypothetical protein
LALVRFVLLNSVLFCLVIVLFVLFWFTAYDYQFGISKLFKYIYILYI